MSIVGISIEIGNGDRKCTRIDAEGNPAEISSDFFEKHPTYAGIKPVTVDGQHMVCIPAFYVRQERSSDNGKTSYRYWISPEPADGFHLHSAFMYIGMPTEAFWLGAYEGSFSADGEICSLPGVMPAGNNDFFDMRAACAARNRDEAMGWRMQNIRMLAAVQRLMIIEAGTTDSQAAYGLGNVQCDGLKKTGESGLCWRGIYDLWGNSITMIDGIILDEQHVIHIEDAKGLGEYINTGVHAASDTGWPTDIAFADGKFFSLSDCFIPADADIEGEPSAAFAPDKTWRSWPDEKNVFYSGGDWGGGSAAGLFFCHFGNVASNSYTTVGCRLAKV